MPLSVLVTRPAEQAAGLVKALEAAGVSTTLLPCLDIQPYLNMSESKAAEVLQSADYCLVTSANAVRHMPRSLRETLQQKHCLAVGPGTAAALDATGVREIQIPEQYSSDGLLALIKAKQLTGEFCVLTGRHPKPLLQEVLNAEVIETYERILPSIDWTRVWSQLQTAKINWVVSTSQESLQNLCTLFKDHTAWLFALNLVVIKPSMRDWAKLQGWQGDIVVTDNATDAAIVSKIA